MMGNSPVESDNRDAGDVREARAFLARCWSSETNDREKHWDRLKKILEDSKPEFL